MIQTRNRIATPRRRHRVATSNRAKGNRRNLADRHLLKGRGISAQNDRHRQLQSDQNTADAPEAYHSPHPDRNLRTRRRNVHVHRQRPKRLHGNLQNTNIRQLVTLNKFHLFYFLMKIKIKSSYKV